MTNIDLRAKYEEMKRQLQEVRAIVAKLGERQVQR